MDTNSLLQEIRSKTAFIGVIGMGYVGLPLALTFAAKGFKVKGFDVDSKKVNQLKEGQSYISHISNETIKQHITGGSLKPSIDFSQLAEMNAIIICVPTPLTKKRQPDLGFVEATASIIQKYLRGGQIVVLESTTYPGCSTEILKPLLEKGGLISGKDFYLGYSPEREDPGNPKFTTERIPKVVGADGPEALKLVTTLYNQIVVETIPVSSMEVAEAVKLTENIFRSVNIALVNELKLIYSKMDIDIREVIDAARTKPFGYMPFSPGPGLGGHCIPIDPFYLTWRAKQVGEETRFIELAGEINTSMPGKVVETLASALYKKFGKSLDKTYILLLGLAYKKNVNDTRESPAYVLIELMEHAGAKVDYFDPYVPVVPPTREHANLTGRQSIQWIPKSFSKYDAAVICTDHDNVNYAELVAACKLIVDTRNATKGITQRRENVLQA